MTPFQLLLSINNDNRKFVIRRKKSDVDWFFLDIHEELKVPPVIWTPRLIQARKFFSEEDVEEFKYAHLRTRPCEIIEIKDGR